MTFKKAFLPAGLIVAIATALLWPTLGILMQQAHMISALVVVIFLINGWEFKLADAQLDRSFAKAFVLSAILSLLGGPFLGLLMAHLLTSDPLMAMGLIVMASVPVTLSSATVMSEISGGNRAWALLITIGLNLLGIFTVPFMVKLTLEGAGNVEISASALLLKLVLLVLLPFIIGIGLRRIFPKVGKIPFLGYIPSTCVILTVYAGFATARELLSDIPFATYPVIGGAALSIHLELMALALLAALLLKLARPERNAFLFVTSQKTLPVAISVITIISPENALALIPCLLFHFIQLLLDSFIASHLAPAKAT